jgi:hypothetical protein
LRPTPSLVVSLVALVVALSGSAYAVVNGGAPTLPKNSVVSKTVKNGSLKAKDFKAGQLPAGPAGPAGPTGPAGLTGPQGPAGPPLETLPSGKTLRGTYAFGSYASASGTYGTTGITFQIPLAEGPIPHYVLGFGPPPPECTGDEWAPTAAPGHLCVYEGAYANLPTARGISNASSTSSLNPFGAIIWATSGPAGSNFSVQGSWAVTAP